jgi:Family of unknown function (DUF6042)
MALLREHTAAEYWADHGILVIRDRDGELDFETAGLLWEGATDAQPGGTIAHAGAGWLWASTSSADAEHEVRLELHDGPPPDDRAEWDDVMETPYLSLGGTVGLSVMTGGDWDEDTLLVGPPGRYRVRVSCRRQPDTENRGDEEHWPGDTWRLQFWAAPGDDEPPRWLARSTPAVPDELPLFDQMAFDPEVVNVLDGAQIAARQHPDGASAAQIAAARLNAEEYGGETGPGAPLWPPLPRPPLTTGHPDRDAVEAQLHAELLADRASRERELAEMAARLGVSPPVTVADALALLVRVGLLTVHEDAGEPRYRVPAEPPRMRDVLDLPAEQAAAIDKQEMFYRCASAASDLVAVALWSEAAGDDTVADLAERLLMSYEEVRAALRHAEQEQLLRVDGDPADAASQLTLTALPRREQEPAGEPRSEPLTHVEMLPQIVIQAYAGDETGIAAQPQIRYESGPASAAWIVASEVSSAGPPPLPEGAPPRAGIVTTSGNLVVWRDGRAEVRPGVPAGANRAVQTPYGVVVLSLARSVLVRPGGQAEVLATDTDYRTGLSADGRHLAVSEARFGRQPRFSLHVIDLADGSRQTLPWPENLTITGMYAGAVYFSSDKAGGLRWSPGSDPERLPWTPRTVDRLTGTMLVEGDEAGVTGWLVIGQDGEARNVLVTENADLIPGGTHLIDFRYSPPAVTLFDVATGGADPRIWWLPAGCDTSVPRSPAWEDEDHLLFRQPYAPHTPAVRLDIRTGAVEGVPFPGVAGDDLAAFVESPR